jgi:predicted lipoprotein
MQKKALKYIISIMLLLVVAYNSVYFKKLDEVKAASTSRKFDAVAYANNFYNKKLVPNLDKSVDINVLLELVKSDPAKAFKEHSHALGIGNIRYFLVHGEGVITSIGENAVSLQLKGDSTSKLIKIATEFVYGNAIRDASGLVDINEFNSTMDFNNVSAEINKIVRTNVLPAFKASAKAGDVVKFSGAIELNQAHLKTDNIEVVPVVLEIVK